MTFCILDNTLRIYTAVVDMCRLSTKILFYTGIYFTQEIKLIHFSIFIHDRGKAFKSRKCLIFVYVCVYHLKF